MHSATASRNPFFFFSSMTVTLLCPRISSSSHFPSGVLSSIIICVIAVRYLIRRKAILLFGKDNKFRDITEKSVSPAYPLKRYARSYLFLLFAPPVAFIAHPVDGLDRRPFRLYTCRTTPDIPSITLSLSRLSPPGSFSCAKVRWTNTVQGPLPLPVMKFDANFPESGIPAFHKISFRFLARRSRIPRPTPHVKTSPSGEVGRHRTEGKKKRKR